MSSAGGCCVVTAIGALLQGCILLAVLENVRGGSGTDEERLMVYLENLTHPNVRPVLFPNQTVNVYMYIAIMDYNMIEQSETFELYAWIFLLWKDKNIRWSTDDYPGIYWTHIPLNRIWNPEIKLLNRRGRGDTLFSSNKVRDVFVHKRGYVWINLQTRLSVPCTLDLTNFPFDAQKCYFNFSAPLYSSKEVNFRTNDYVWRWWSRKRKYSQWTLLTSTVSNKVVPLPTGREGSGDTYRVAMAEVKFRRISTYYAFVYIMPVVVASLLTVTTFVLPPGNSQKITLGSGLLVLYSVMFLELSVILPPFHATVPLLDKYYMAMYMILALSVLFSTVTTNLTKRSEGVFTPPEFFRQLLVDYIGKAVCLPYSPTEYKRNITPGFANVNVEGATPAPATVPTAKPKEPEVISEWLHIAAIIDRVLLVFYLLLTVVTTVAILKGLNTAS